MIHRLSQFASHRFTPSYDWTADFQRCLDQLAQPRYPHRGDEPHVLLLDVPRIEIRRTLRICPTSDAPLSLTIKADAPRGAYIVQREADQDVLSLDTADGNVRALDIRDIVLLNGRRGLVVDNSNYLTLGPLVCQGQSQCAVAIGSDKTHRNAPYLALDRLHVYHLGDGAESMRIAGGYSVHCKGMVIGEKAGAVVVERGSRLWIDGDRLVRTRDWMGGDMRRLIESAGVTYLRNADVLIRDEEMLRDGDVRMDDSVEARRI